MKKDQDNKTFDLFATPSFGTNAREMARNTDPDTSHEAAEKVDTARLERMVYEVICKYPNGCIADDVERELSHLRSHSITPRFAPLIRKGFIFDTGLRRAASSGRSQRIVKALKKVETT
jgi:hypothetical protein